ncbi:MAG: glutathione S-transferase C-terminal domain-containing protein [Proteobacteria bacterium]|nr:glutathione S-transferase C-terminal domain-containing protein [Pseudomonadota bacterium]
MYRLHGFCQSGNTYKVALTLRLLEQPFETVFVDYMSGATRAAGWREQTNEMGEAPVLDDGERRLTQSGVILTYLAEKHGRFGGADADARREVLRWLFFDNHKFTSFFATYRFMKAFGPTAPDPAVMAFLRGRIDGAFAIVDKHLAGRRYMVGDAPTVADFSLCGYLYFPLDESGYEIAGRYPNIDAWRGRIRAMEGWVDPYDVLPGNRIAPKW